MNRLALAIMLVAWPATVLAQNTTGTTSPNTTSLSPTPTIAREAAILVCGADVSTGISRLLVSGASTSGGVTAPAPGAQCAQALADLFGAGFAVIDVQSVNQQLQYTLVR